MGYDYSQDTKCSNRKRASRGWPVMVWCAAIALNNGVS